MNILLLSVLNAFPIFVPQPLVVPHAVTPRFIYDSKPLPPPIFVLRGPGNFSVTVNYTKAQLEAIVNDTQHFHADKGEALMALEILRLREVCKAAAP